jgi:hypothetical protein
VPEYNKTVWTYDADGRLTSEDSYTPVSSDPPDGLAATITIPAGYNLASASVTLTWDGSEFVTPNETSWAIQNGEGGVVLLPPGQATGQGGNGSDWIVYSSARDSCLSLATRRSSLLHHQPRRPLRTKIIHHKRALTLIGFQSSHHRIRRQVPAAHRPFHRRGPPGQCVIAGQK